MAWAMPERAALVAVGQVEAEVLPVAQQLDDVADALAADDDHHLADAHRGQRLDRVVDHRPVVDRQQVLVGDDRQREQPRGGAAGQHDALHRPREAATGDGRTARRSAGPLGRRRSRAPASAGGTAARPPAACRLLGLGGALLGRAVDRLLRQRRQAALVVGDDEHELEPVQVGRRLQVGGLDDVVGVAPDVDDLADEQALGVRRADAAAELDAGGDDLDAERRSARPSRSGP